jgi:hypothetical protein
MMIFVAGLGLAILATTVLDVVLTRRSAKRRQRLASAEVGAEPKPVDPPMGLQEPVPATTATQGALEAR